MTSGIVRGVIRRRFSQVGVVALAVGVLGLAACGDDANVQSRDAASSTAQAPASESAQSAASYDTTITASPPPASVAPAPSQSSSAENLYLTRDDSGRTFELPRGARFTIHLDGDNTQQAGPCCSPPTAYPDGFVRRTSVDDDPSTGSNTTEWIAETSGEAQLVSGVRCPEASACPAIAYFSVIIDVT